MDSSFKCQPAQPKFKSILQTVKQAKQQKKDQDKIPNPWYSGPIAFLFSLFHKHALESEYKKGRKRKIEVIKQLT